MADSKSKNSYFGWAGFVCGALALAICIIHYYTGPLVKEPSLSETAKEKISSTAQSMKDKATSIFKKKDTEEATKPEEKQDSEFNLDKKIDLAAVILGVLALILATVSFIKHENIRASGMAGAFGAGAVLFQLIGWALAFIGVIIILGFTFFRLAKSKNPDTA